MPQWGKSRTHMFMPLHGASVANRRLIALVAVAVAFLALAWSLPLPASAHYTGCNSVSFPSRQVHWGGSTKYVAARDYALAAWNALGRVPFIPDQPITVQDLTFRDTYREDVMWVGEHFCIPIPGIADPVTFNSYFMDVYSDAKQKNVALHELGHALQLDHTFAGNIMYEYATPQVTFGEHDLDDYTGKWGAIPSPMLSITDAQVTERDSGTVDAIFTVRLSAVPRDAVSVRFQTVNGSASGGSDFVSASGPLTFPAGTPTLSRTVTVQVIGDTVDEEDESFFVDLTNPQGAPVSDGRGIGTIRDNDGAPSEPIPGDPEYCALHPKDPACSPLLP